MLKYFSSFIVSPLSSTSSTFPRMLRVVLFAALLSCCVAFVPTGSWVVNGNGYPGLLSISSVTNGLLYGTFYGVNIYGTWSTTENRISLLRLIDATPGDWQEYIGYYNAGTNQIQGYFIAFYGTGGTPTVHRVPFVATPGSTLPSYTFETATYVQNGAWQANSNGYTGTFSVSCSSAGALTGTFLGSTIQSGYCDVTTREFSWIIVTANTGSSPSTTQVYTGYLTQYTDGFNTYQLLAGYFTAYPGTGATADVADYGWSAEIIV